MTDLRTRLHADLDDQHTDLALLAARAETMGGRIRRRRRIAVATGSVAMAAVLATGVVTTTRLLSGPDEARSVTEVATQEPATVPASGRSAAAALYATVGEVADGTVDHVKGGLMAPVTDDGTGVDVAEHVAAFVDVTPPGAVGAGEVSVDITHRLAPGELWDMLADLRCREDMADCRRSTLADGSEVLTYALADSGMVYAKRLIGDLVVTVWAAPPSPGGSAVLSVEQVEEIASQPWWGLELPAEFAGDQLPSFEVLGHDGTLGK